METGSDFRFSAIPVFGFIVCFWFSQGTVATVPYTFG